MTPTLLQVEHELLLNGIAEGLHVLGIARKEPATERATTPLPELGIVVHKRLGNVVNVERTKLVTLGRPHVVQCGKILPSHALNTDIEPRKVRALKRVLRNDLLEHRLASHTKEILRRRIALIKVLGLLNAVLTDLCALLCEREVLKGHWLELRLCLEMNRTKRTKRLHIFGLAEDHKVLIRGHRGIRILQIVVGRSIPDRLGGILHLRQIKLRRHNRPVVRSLRRRKEFAGVKPNHSGTRPVSHLRDIHAMLGRDLVPELVTHRLELPDVVANHEALVILLPKPLLELPLTRALVGINIQKDEGRIQKAILPARTHCGVPEILQMIQDVGNLGQLILVLDVKRKNGVGGILGEGKRRSAPMGTNVKDVAALELTGKIREKTVVFAPPDPQELFPKDLSILLTKTIQADGLNLVEHGFHPQRR